MEFLALIPARYASTRFPGKPLADLDGRPMIRYVYETAASFFSACYVATDDERIFDTVKGFGGRAVMTASTHRSGTDRCREALDRVEEIAGRHFDVVVNIQGDEPFLSVGQLQRIVGCFDEASTQIATLVKPFGAGEDVFNPNSPKVVCSADGHALYFSRSPIPFLRGVERDRWQESYRFLKHIGLYAYRSDVLRQITELPQGELEKKESLEQLRWLENGFRIRVAETDSESLAIDTPEDLVAAVAFMRKKGK